MLSDGLLAHINRAILRMAHFIEGVFPQEDKEMDIEFLLQVLQGNSCACRKITAGSFEEEVDAGFFFPNVSIPGIPELPEKFDFVITEPIIKNIPASEIPFRIFKAGTVRDWIPDYIYPDYPTYWTGFQDSELEIKISEETKTLLKIKFLKAQKQAYKKFIDQLKAELANEQAKYGAFLLERPELEGQLVKD